MNEQNDIKMVEPVQVKVQESRRNKNYLVFQLLLILSLGSLFIWQSWETIEKYLAGKTTMQVTLYDDGDILFPSITFCKRTTLDKYPGVIEMLNTNNTMSERDARDLALNHTWGQDRVFTFLSQEKMAKKRFPCETKRGGKPGKPCVFPFLYPDCNLQKKVTLCKQVPIPEIKKYTTCTNIATTTPWCATRTYMNMSYVVGHWGYCSPNCNGEVPLSNQSNYNLAHSIYNNMWEEDIYNLETWGEGHCHTYNPPYQ